MVDGVSPNMINDAFQQPARPKGTPTPSAPSKRPGSGTQAKSTPQSPPQMHVQIIPDTSEALSGADKERRKKVETDLENSLNKKVASHNPSDNAEKEIRAIEKDVDALEKKLDNLENNRSSISPEKARKLHEEIQNGIDSLRYRSILLSRSALDIAAHQPADETRMRGVQDEIIKDVVPRLDRVANRLAGFK